MKLINRNEIFLLLDDLKCPFCNNEKKDQNDWNNFKVHENLFYGRCKICGGSIKLMKRKIKHFQDHRYFEYVFKDIQNQTIAVRGYYISEKTFEKNLLKLSVKDLYSRMKFSEIDDLWNDN